MLPYQPEGLSLGKITASLTHSFRAVLCCAKSLQSCPTLCDPMDGSPPGSSVHGILQARILEWVAMPSSRGSSQPRDQTHISHVSCIGRQVLYHWRHLGSSLEPVFHNNRSHCNETCIHMLFVPGYVFPFSSLGSFHVSFPQIHFQSLLCFSFFWDPYNVNVVMLIVVPEIS